MPGLAVYETVLRSAGLWETQSSNLTDTFDFGGGPLWLVFCTVVLWLYLFGLWTNRHRAHHHKDFLWVVLPLVCGKVFDMVLEGRSWSGSYWALASCIVMVIQVRWKNMNTS